MITQWKVAELGPDYIQAGWAQDSGPSVRITTREAGVNRWSQAVDLSRFDAAFATALAADYDPAMVGLAVSIPASISRSLLAHIIQLSFETFAVANFLAVPEAVSILSNSAVPTGVSVRIDNTLSSVTAVLPGNPGLPLGKASTIYTELIEFGQSPSGQPPSGLLNDVADVVKKMILIHGGNFMQQLYSNIVLSGSRAGALGTSTLETAIQAAAREGAKTTVRMANSPEAVAWLGAVKLLSNLDGKRSIITSAEYDEGGAAIVSGYI